MNSTPRSAPRIARFGSALLMSLALSLVPQLAAGAQTSQAGAQERPFVVEYYYKARWGFADEFIRLFKKNHFPVLQKEMELGRILHVTAASPRYHGTEDGRWDYRVTIVWKSVQVSQDGFDTQPILKQLYPDQETFKREEQRRFEILLAHWDLPIVDVDLEK
jgi:hypothetical protein